MCGGRAGGKERWGALKEKNEIRLAREGDRGQTREQGALAGGSKEQLWSRVAGKGARSALGRVARATGKERRGLGHWKEGLA
jgi:hypothetical protein